MPTAVETMFLPTKDNGKKDIMIQEAALVSVQSNPINITVSSESMFCVTIIKTTHMTTIHNSLKTALLQFPPTLTSISRPIKMPKILATGTIVSKIKESP